MFCLLTAGQPGSPLHRSMNEIAAHSFSDNTVYGVDAETASLSSSISLTEAQERAISGKILKLLSVIYTS